MKPVQRTFAIVALTTTLVSCGVRHSPATTAVLTAMPPRVSATMATYPLLSDLLYAYGDGSSAYILDYNPANAQTHLDNLQNDHIHYFTTHHVPIHSSLWAAPIAQDAIAIIAHPSANVSNITLDQLRQIYNGKITALVDIGGVGGELIVFSREDGTSTRAELERMVMGNRRTTANARLALTDEQMVKLVGETEGAVGYVSWGLLNTMSEPNVIILRIENIAPTRTTIYDHIYPLSNMIYIVGKAEPQDSIRPFIGWIQSQEGQKVVMVHYVPLLMPTVPQSN